MIRRFLKWFYGLFWEVPDQTCQCGHLRCMHHRGKHECFEYKDDSAELGKFCRCRKFIPKRGGDGGTGKFHSPTPRDLERLVRCD